MAGSDNNINFGDGVRLEPSDARGHSIMQKSGDDIGLMNVSGDPEGVVPANPGSKAFDRSSGCEYIKVTGTGVTGWERIQSGETVATTYQSDSGSAQAAGNILNLSGGTGIDTTAAGSTVTFNFDETEVPAIATSYETQSGTAVPVNNVLQVDGVQETLTRGSGDTVSVFSPRLAKYVVDPTTDLGTHTTIASAIAAASAGETIFIRPGTYTENLTIKDGINLGAVIGSATNGNVTIEGKLTFSGAVTSTFSGIKFITNGDNIISATGSGANQSQFIDCVFFYDDADAISVNNSSASLSFVNCNFVQQGNSVNLITATACGECQFLWCNESTAGFTVGNSTVASGTVSFLFCKMGGNTFTTSSGGIFRFNNTSYRHSDNKTFLTTAGTGTSYIENCTISSGTSAAISVGSGTTVQMWGGSIESTNANPVTGAGTFIYDRVGFISTGNGINATTSTARSLVTGQVSFDDGTNYLDYYEEGSWTPSITGSTSNPTVSYSTQLGKYTRIGDLVTVKCTITINTISGGSGAVRISGLPFTASNDSMTSVGSFGQVNGLNFPTSTVDVSTLVFGNAAYTQPFSIIDNTNGASVDMTDLANGDNFRLTVTYWV